MAGKVNYKDFLLSDQEWIDFCKSLTDKESFKTFHRYFGKLSTVHYSETDEAIFIRGHQKPLDTITNEELIETKYLDKDNNMSSFYERWGINKPWNANKVIVMSQTPTENTIDVYGIYKYRDTFAISQPIFCQK